MLIRAATPDDRPAISAMVHASYSTLLADSYAPDVLAAALPEMSHVPMDLAQCGTYFIALIDGAVVGAAGWTTGPEGAELRKVAVHPAHLRRGIGGALMTHVHTTAKAAGHTTVHCSASLNAVRFYTALGYSQTGQTRMSTGQPDLKFDAVTMELRIN